MVGDRSRSTKWSGFSRLWSIWMLCFESSQERLCQSWPVDLLVSCSALGYSTNQLDIDLRPKSLQEDHIGIARGS
ncbi:hypothetical protein BDV24DRAFT_139513, partial [Aspergillus arachidicola]